MGILQYLLPRLQIPAAQYRVTHVHKAVQVQKARHQPRRGGAQQRAQRQYDGEHAREPQGQEGGKPHAPRPHKTGYQSHKGQARHHLPPGTLPPDLLRAGDRQKRTPRHEKAVDPVRHGSVLLSTRGRCPPSFHTPRQTPPPVPGRYAPAPGRRSPSSPRSPRRRAKYRRTRR